MRTAATTPTAGLEEPRTARASAEDVQFYLTQQPRQLPSRYLYDELGSVLFEAICRLPWYGLKRAEMRLLETHAPEILHSRAPSTVVELGPGSGDKLATLIAAAGSARGVLHVRLIDVSRSALAQASVHSTRSPTFKSLHSK